MQEKTTFLLSSLEEERWLRGDNQNYHSGAFSTRRRNSDFQALQNLWKDETELQAR